MWRRLLTVVVAVCACAWVAPRQADASCGDYVMIGGHQRVRHQSLSHQGVGRHLTGLQGTSLGSARPSGDVQGFGDHDLSGDSDPSREELASRRHEGGQSGFPVCDGPGCRQRREAPTSPPTRVTVEEHSWGLLPRIVKLTLEASHFVDLSIESATAFSVATGIFRPPRA